MQSMSMIGMVGHEPHDIQASMSLQAIAIFGRNVFQTWDGKKFTGTAIDITLWDMVMLTLVDYSSADLQPYADRLQQALLNLKLQLRSERAQVSQDHIQARRKNFTNMIDTVRGQTSHHNQQARTFSPDLKVMLTCF